MVFKAINIENTCFIDPFYILKIVEQVRLVLNKPSFKEKFTEFCKIIKTIELKKIKEKNYLNTLIMNLKKME